MTTDQTGLRPYYQDASVTIYNCDWREVVNELREAYAAGKLQAAESRAPAMPTTREPRGRIAYMRELLQRASAFVKDEGLRASIKAELAYPVTPMSEQVGSLRHRIANLAERHADVAEIVLPLGDRELIVRLARDIEAFAYGMGGAESESAEQLAWFEKAQDATTALMQNVDALLERCAAPVPSEPTPLGQTDWRKLPEYELVLEEVAMFERSDKAFYEALDRLCIRSSQENQK